MGQKCVKWWWCLSGTEVRSLKRQTLSCFNFITIDRLHYIYTQDLFFCYPKVFRISNPSVKSNIPFWHHMNIHWHEKKNPRTNHIHTFIHQSSDPSNMRRGCPGLHSIHASIIKITAVSFYCKRVPKTSNAGNPRCAAWTYGLPICSIFFGISALFGLP